MKKSYKLENLSCGHCASQIEDAVGKLDGVNSAKLNFTLLKLKLEGDSKEDLPSKENLQSIVDKIEPECRVI